MACVLVSVYQFRGIEMRFLKPQILNYYFAGHYALRDRSKSGGE